MTFLYNNYCSLASRFEHSGEAEYTAGVPGGLTVSLISSGQCSIFQNAGALMAQAGCLVVAGQAQRLVPVGGCHVLGVTLKGKAALELAENFETPLVLNSTACPDVPALIDTLVAGDSSDAEISALGYTLLCLLASTDTSAKPLPPLVAAAISDIREHYAEVYGVEELAKQLNVSKSHLVRSFTAATGVSPGRYLTNVRIEAAKRLLAKDEYSLEIVATLCGFSGANYLCKVFKKATGETPAAWRAKALPNRYAEHPSHEFEEMLFL